MSDYLANLVARTISPAPSLRPQIQSLFEPSSARAGFTPDPIDFNTYAESNENAAPEVPLPVPVRSLSAVERLATQKSPDRAMESLAEPPRPAKREPFPAPEEPEASPWPLLMPTPVRRPAPEPVPPESPNASEVSVVESNRRSSVDHRRSPTPILVERGNSAPAEPAFPNQQSSASLPPSPHAPLIPMSSTADRECSVAPQERGDERKERHYVTPLVQQVTSKQIIASDPPPLIAPVSSIITPRLAKIAPPAPAAPSTIHVTIGRVEVRATPLAVAPPRHQAAPAPVMSLQEYLRDRADGGRR